MTAVATTTKLVQKHYKQHILRSYVSYKHEIENKPKERNTQTKTMDVIDKLPLYQQQAIRKDLENMQVRDSLVMYNNLVHTCFGTCITSFRSKTLEKNESLCIEQCSNRYIKTTQRVGLRFAEHNQSHQQQQQQQQQSSTTTNSEQV